MAFVKALCTSDRKGVRKQEVDQIELKKEGGIEGDAHGADIVRQVSFLGDESVDKLRDMMPQLAAGDFAENILTEGVTWYELPIGTRFRIGDVLFEMTQIGKECHHGCEIKKLTGDCVMPREGVFAKVLEEGTIKKGDEIEVLS